jgi:hypothetical protein
VEEEEREGISVEPGLLLSFSYSFENNRIGDKQLRWQEGERVVIGRRRIGRQL